MRYSIIVPVFNRPDEVDELLESLTHQTEKDFEVVIVEDQKIRKYLNERLAKASVLVFRAYW